MNDDESLRAPLRGPFRNAFTRYLAATRPAFLTVTFAGSLIGLGTAAADGLAIDFARALVTLLFALVAHAGANVINDYFDALNGSDALNTELLHPYTGGSRFIQNGYLSLAEMRRFGYLLLAAVVPGGLWLTIGSGPGLVVIGLTGLLVAWAYSAPPFKLMSRGIGEAAITAGWLLVALGTDYVQRGELAALPLVAGLPFALLVAAILYINQFPDRRADEAAGKRTVVVRLGPQAASRGYAMLVALAYLWLLGALIAGALPASATVALLPVVLSVRAARSLMADAGHPSRLVPPIRDTIAAANLSGVLLAAGLAVSRLFA
ncbi:prenyltransferase [Thauera sp. Sel9]|uniref:prenyltransferase n=1 Tax=Thauera sp. Sel9 TaxID=2974299 RepID=UPI0021E12C54|nr:prenyltransferase [Thauera sp. Sel9]MCV2218948.1 prenyltransferase [Thauera sp. Sel9]